MKIAILAEHPKIELSIVKLKCVTAILGPTMMATWNNAKTVIILGNKFSKFLKIS